MAIPLTPNTVKVCMNFLQNGELTCQVYHVDVNTNPTTSILTNVATVFRDWFQNWQDGTVNDETDLQTITVTDVSEVDGEGIEFSDGLPLSGTAEGNPLPNNCTVVTKLATGFTGRSRRGRKYAVGLADIHVNADAQTITTVFQAALNAIFEELIDAMVSEGWKLVVNSLVSGGAPRTTGLNTEILSASTDLTLDSQRRRLPGRGQ